LQYGDGTNATITISSLVGFFVLACFGFLLLARLIFWESIREFLPLWKSQHIKIDQKRIARYVVDVAHLKYIIRDAVTKSEFEVNSEMYFAADSGDEADLEYNIFAYDVRKMQLFKDQELLAKSPAQRQQILQRDTKTDHLETFKNFIPFIIVVILMCGTAFFCMFMTRFVLGLK
jgi:hypothetical protein